MEMEVLSLTTLEVDVLLELSRTRVTLSAVSLASDLWPDRVHVGDPFGLVCFTLKGLNERDLVTYRVGYNDVPVEIRLTRSGWSTVGYPVLARQVGLNRWSRVSETPLRASDRTDFRTHSSSAEYGTVERMPLVEHCFIYREHASLHAEQLAELNGEEPSKGEIIVARPGTWTPNMETRALALRTQGASYQTIADTLSRDGISVSGVTVGAHLRPIEQKAQNRAVAREIDQQTGLRTSILTIVAEAGRVDDAREIPELIAKRNGPRTDIHSVVHLLWAMQKQGLVAFRERTNGGSAQSSVYRISATLLGRQTVGLAPTLDEQIVTPDPEVESLSFPQDDYPIPEPEQAAAVVVNGPEIWLHLTLLREREQEQAGARTTIQQLLDAAQALQSVDQIASDSLVERAAIIERALISITPLEREYLAFADKHEV